LSLRQSSQEHGAFFKGVGRRAFAVICEPQAKQIQEARIWIASALAFATTTEAYSAGHRGKSGGMKPWHRADDVRTDETVAA
jgi:hypothetical protein